MFYEKDVLKNFAKFAGKHLYQILFFIKDSISDVTTFKLRENISLSGKTLISLSLKFLSLQKLKTDIKKLHGLAPHSSETTSIKKYVPSAGTWLKKNAIKEIFRI